MASDSRSSTSAAPAAVDLSEFDPFHVPPRIASPRIFAPPSPSPTHPSRVNGAAAVPPPPVTLPTQTISTKEDPLDSFASLMDLNDSSGFDATALGNGVTTSAVPLHEQVQLNHSQRHDAVLSDLSREPFASTSALGRAGSAPRHAHAISPPPRRLSGLMDSHSSLFHASSPTNHGDSADVPAFHAASPLSPERVENRIRRLSIDLDSAAGLSIASTSPQPKAKRMPSSPEWGEFFSGPSTLPHSTNGSDRHHDLHHVSAPTPTRSQTVPAPRPPPPSQPPSKSGSMSLDRRDSPDIPEKHGIKLVGVRPGVQRVLEEDVAERIRSALPPRLRISSRWNLVYSLDQHGISLMTLYERMRVGAPKGEAVGIVVAVKDERGDVFGAFVNERLRPSEGYYGDGTCFVWKSLPFPPDDPRLIPAVRTYRWTGRTDYLTLTQSTFLAFGGGYDGKFGLWIDERLEKGYSTQCEAFLNEPLVNEAAWSASGDGGVEAKLEVFGLECWAVGL